MGEPLEAFHNRLRKMARHFGRWARRTGVSAYRVYDRDVPGYRFAIDVYETEPLEPGGLSGRCVHLQVYAPSRPDAPPPPPLGPVRAAVREILEVDDAHLFCKRRERQKGMGQYQRLADAGCEAVVREGPARFIVNLSDRLDTGLFLDHRPTRALVRESARELAVLNLFAYTGSFSVHAALGGARESTTLDLHRGYLRWAERNFALNGIATGGRHRLVRADAMAWLAEAGSAPRYDLIVIDPPTHSRSSRMARDFSVQRDHVALLERAAALLRPGGRILFSTNYRRFRLDTEALAGWTIRDITARTTDPDFRRRPLHTAWWLEPPGGGG